MHSVADTFPDQSHFSIFLAVGTAYNCTEIMRSSAQTHGSAMLLSFGLLLIAMPSALGLSDTICNNIQAEWQSDESRLQGAFPFYTLLGKPLVAPKCCYQALLWFPSLFGAVSCIGNLTLEGYSVDSCVNNGRDCGAPAADAFCNYLGIFTSFRSPFTFCVHCTHALLALTQLSACRTRWISL